MTAREVLSNAAHSGQGRCLHQLRTHLSPNRVMQKQPKLGSVYCVGTFSGETEHLPVSVGLLDLHPPKRAALLKICYFLHYCELKARRLPPQEFYVSYIY